MTVRTRFSPSPTGKIHLGNARAALFAALYAAENEGVFILRIEDTDATRSEEQHVDLLQKDLRWLNINWGEGPEVGGPYGPYWQSQRQAIYAKYYAQLESNKLIYPCFCSDQTLMLDRKLQLSRGQAPRYSGKCRQLSVEDINQRLAANEKPAWRFIVPPHNTVEFLDTVKGMQQFKTDDIGDFIIRRADGTAPFLFCNAIDDALMKVTHVLRGEDHLANTPRQIMILKALDLPVPHYGHLSLIVGDDGAPLSKRHGSFSINDLRERGYLAKAIINYLVRLGHTCDTQDLLDFNRLATHFHLDKLSKSPARFDLSQLMYWQKNAVHALTLTEVWEWLGASLKEKTPADKQTLFAETVKANVAFPRDAETWQAIFFGDELSFDEAEKNILRDAGETFFVAATEAFDQHPMALPAVLDSLKQSLGVNGKKLFMPLRIALTSQINGPELAQIVALLGEKKVKERLMVAAEIARAK